MLHWSISRCNQEHQGFTIRDLPVDCNNSSIAAGGYCSPKTATTQCSSTYTTGTKRFQEVSLHKNYNYLLNNWHASQLLLLCTTASGLFSLAAFVRDLLVLVLLPDASIAQLDHIYISSAASNSGTSCSTQPQVSDTNFPLFCQTRQIFFILLQTTKIAYYFAGRQLP